MKRLSGLKTVVTGASKGIGRAIALAYAAEGAEVAVTARTSAALDEVVAALAAQGCTAVRLVWDIAAVSEAEACLAEAKRRLGGLDVLVNNAGVIRGNAEHPVADAEALWDYTMDVNLKGLYFACQGAAQVMQAQKHGVIINLASDAGFRGAPNPYCISKWGVVGFTRGLAQQLAPHGVRVCGIAPGPVATEMMGWQPGQSMTSPGLPLGRYALPEEVARVAVFLASADAVAVYGESIVLNSGNP
jgi:3-oxoacyl-[acyl-carrier protein] reductase